MIASRANLLGSCRCGRGATHRGVEGTSGVYGVVLAEERYFDMAAVLAIRHETAAPGRDDDCECTEEEMAGFPLADRVHT